MPSACPNLPETTASALHARASQTRAENDNTPGRRLYFIALLWNLLEAAALINKAAFEAADRALDAALAHLAPPPGPNPHRAFNRTARAMVRLVALIMRLEQRTPLPQPTAAAARPLQALRSLTPLRRKPRAPLKGVRAPRSSEADIEALLRKHSVPEIIALICRDLGVTADLAYWTNATPSEDPTLPPLVHPAYHANSNHRPAPAHRPARTSDPPARHG